MKIDFKEIKLIIWDLDDTFWNGTISEESIELIPTNIEIIKNATDSGVVNSICSKNDFETAKSKLVDENLWEYFVFPSINWENKAQRLKAQIEAMALRPDNVLFIDDNSFNLKEANHYLPNLMIASPGILEDLNNYFLEIDKNDTARKRLKRYKLLEEKAEESLKYDSNEDFLFSSNIQIYFNSNCELEIDRIHELINRTNQLNFTKERIEIEELKKIIDDPNIQTEYITVEDKFGDYGIVGFYALQNNKLQHFLFSCRTMGQGIEQYVFAYLGFPELEIKGEVQGELKKDFFPSWINQNKNSNISLKQNKSNHLILLKGPCDLSSTEVYLKNSQNLVTEFTYVNIKNNATIEDYNHSVHILGLQEYSKDENSLIARECIFIDEKMLSGTFFKENYNLIFLSTAIESSHGIYQRKGSNLKVAFGGYKKPLTDKNYWNEYINNSNINEGNQFTMEYLKEFSQKYEFVGRTEPEDYIKIINKILNYLRPTTTLCLILSPEYPYEMNEKKHLHHIEMNKVIKEMAKDNPRLTYIELSKIATVRNDFTNSINHYKTRVYYDLSQEIIKIIDEKLKLKIQSYPKTILFMDNALIKAKELFKNNISVNNILFKFLQPIYKILSRKKSYMEK